VFRFLILEFGFIARVLREDALGQFWNQQVDEGLRALFAGVAPTRNARNDPFGNDGGIDWRQRPVKAPRRDERDTFVAGIRILGRAVMAALRCSLALWSFVLLITGAMLDTMQHDACHILGSTVVSGTRCRMV
jgi:hypothetical protein